MERKFCANSQILVQSFETLWKFGENLEKFPKLLNSIDKFTEVILTLLITLHNMPQHKFRNVDLIAEAIFVSLFSGLVSDLRRFIRGIVNIENCWL